MSKEAARSFISAVKSTRNKFKSDVNEYYKDFIQDKKTPTANDIKALAQLIKEAEEDAKAYHADVDQAMQGFGGTADTSIGTAKTLLQTMQKKLK